MFDLLSRLPLSFTPTVLNQGTSDIESPSTREEAGVDLVTSRLLLKRNSVRRWTMCFPVPARPRVLAWSENGSCQAEDQGRMLVVGGVELISQLDLGLF